MGSFSIVGTLNEASCGLDMMVGREMGLNAKYKYIPVEALTHVDAGCYQCWSHWCARKDHHIMFCIK